jgi:hypothetical protein
MEVGTLEGYPVIYSESDDTVFCKNITILAEKLIDGYESTLDRYSVGKGIVLRKYPNEFTLGCFSFSHNEGKQLIKKIKHARSNKTP